MERKRRQDKLDGIDYRNISTTIGSAGWQLIRERLQLALARKVDDLVLPHNETETATIRGFIAGLKTALEIPAILLKEAKENTRDGDGTSGI